MNHKTQLIFHGEILPGHDLITVKGRLAALLKLAPGQVESVFSGQRIVLHKGLPAGEVARYVAHLEQLGARVYAEPLVVASADPIPLAAAASVTPPVDVPVAHAKPELAPAELVTDEMSCPKCGERQPKRPLCRSCAVDMKRFAEAQETARREECEARLAAKRGEAPAGSAGVFAGPSGEGAASLFGTSFAGRIGRFDYLIGGLLCFAIFLFGVTALVRGMNLAFFLLASVVCCVSSFRLAALRCHDKGWSGWMSLVMLVPYLGWLFGLLLMVLPGERNNNRFGAPKRPLPVPAMLGMVAVFGLSAMTVARSPDGIEQFKTMMSGSQMAEAGERAGRQSSRGAVAKTEVEIFTTTTCSECARAKAYMKNREIAFVERDVEFDIDTRREFYARGGKGVPYIFVRGQSMLGFDEGVFEHLLAGG